MYEELTKCWKKHKSAHPSRSTDTKQIASESSDVSSVRSITTFIKHKRNKSRDEPPSPTISRSVPRSTTLETVTSETSDSQWNITKYVSRRAQVFLKNPKKYISSFEEDISEETRQHFREHFALPENEKLYAGTYCNKYCFYISLFITYTRIFFTLHSVLRIFLAYASGVRQILCIRQLCLFQV